LDDLESNEEKNSLALAGKKLRIPYLIIQGTNDQAVKWMNLTFEEAFYKAKNHIITNVTASFY
jgi:hypothetical protein